MKANQFKNLFQRNWASLACCGLALAGVLLVSCNATVPTTTFPKISGESNVNAGDIAFTGVVYNGNSQFSFVPTTNIASGVTIFFTTYTYDPTNSSSPIAPFVDESTTSTSSSTYSGYGSVVWQSGVTTGAAPYNNATTIYQGTVAYVTGSSGLASYSQVVIGAGSAVTLSNLQNGSVFNVAGSNGNTYLFLNHNGAGNKILAYTGSASSPAFVAGIMFGPDAWLTAGPVAQGAFWDSVLPTSLTVGSNAIDLSSLWVSGNLAQYNVLNTGTAPSQNDNAVLNSCQSSLANIVNASNWKVDGNQAKGSVNMTGVAITPCGGSAGYTGSLP